MATYPLSQFRTPENRNYVRQLHARDGEVGSKVGGRGGARTETAGAKMTAGECFAKLWRHAFRYEPSKEIAKVLEAEKAMDEARRSLDRASDRLGAVVRHMKRQRKIATAEESPKT